MNKKVTLIYPGITESGFNSIKGNEGSWLNHGLCSLSACLKDKNIEVALIDLRRLSGWDHFRREVKENHIGAVVGITMMSCDYDPAVQAARIIKEEKPQTNIVAGGPHPSIIPEELIAEKNIDYIFRGEGELTFPELVENIISEKNIDRIVQGVSPSIEDLPYIDRMLFKSPEEPFVTFLKPPFVTIIAGRGCRYNCNYCQPAERIMFGHNVRRRSVDNVIGELKVLRDTRKFNSMMIHDDCITEDTRWMDEFCKRYLEEGFKQPFVCQSRADIICKNEGMVKKMKDAGLALFIIGFESGSQRVLNFLRKGCTVEQNYKAADICRSVGIKIWANYMLGIPTETKEEQRETVDMIKSIKPYHSSPAYYTPHPGSDLFDYCAEKDLSLIKDHSGYRRSRYEPKIKGVDYEYLEKLMYESVAAAEDQQVLPQKIKRSIPVGIRHRLKGVRDYARSFLSGQ